MSWLINFSNRFLGDKKLKSILTKTKATILFLLCMGIFFILIALDGFDDYINFGNVFLYNLIFIFGIFLFSCGIHKLKLEILDTLIINISSIAIAILLFDYFLDIQPEHSFANFMFSVEGLQTLLVITIIYGTAFFILELIFIHFFMDKIRIPDGNKIKIDKIKAEDLFPHLKIRSALFLFVISPTILWIISLFLPEFSVNFLGAVVGVLLISSLTPRWGKLLSKMGVILNYSLEKEDEFAKTLALTQVGRHDEAIKYTKKSEGETYSNDEYGFSMKCPEGWINDNINLPSEMLFQYIDNMGGSINLVAGPTFTAQETIKDLENLARRNVKNIRGKWISLNHIKVDGFEAIEAIYLALGNKTKKVAFVIDNIEYIITCGVIPSRFDEYEVIFDRCIHSFKMIRSNKEMIPQNENNSQWDPSYN